MKNSSAVLVLTGTSGVGKDTIINIITSNSDFTRFPAHTTRPARSGELDGTHYNFVDKESFEVVFNAGELLERFEVDGHYYGIHLPSLYESISCEKNLILHLSVEGKNLLTEKVPEAVCVFIMEPSHKAIVSRLRKRGMPEEQIINRIKHDPTTLQDISLYDLVVVNHDNEAEETAERVLNFVQ